MSAASSAVSPPAAPIRVESLSPEGRGVARIGGKVTFIQGALPGEMVEVRLHHRRARRDEGVATRILQAAPHRVPPPCSHYAACGGCSLQHLDPTVQLEHKQRVLLERLATQDVFPERVLAPVRGATLGYRRRARPVVRWSAERSELLLGFRDRAGRQVSDLRSCAVLDPHLGRLLPALTACLRQLRARARIPQLELVAGEESRAVVLRHLDPLSAVDLERLRRFEEEQEELALYLQSAGPDSLAPLSPGRVVTPLCYRLPHPPLRLEFGPLDFVQVHAEINIALVQSVLELLQPSAREHIADLYCGVGNLSLPLATHAARVSAFDVALEMVRRGEANAAANDLSNVRFAAADLAHSLPAGLVGAGVSKLILDPPRAGAPEVVRHFPLEGVQRLLYVSCDSATLARDAAVLCRRGLRCAAVGVLDMFPHTAHCESLALFLEP